MHQTIFLINQFVTKCLSPKTSNYLTTPNVEEKKGGGRKGILNKQINLGGNKFPYDSPLLRWRQYGKNKIIYVVSLHFVNHQRNGDKEREIIKEDRHEMLEKFHSVFFYFLKDRKNF